jgi:hypothetical protein
VTGELNFTPAGEGAVGSYGILRFNTQNKIDQAGIRYRTVGPHTNPIVDHRLPGLCCLADDRSKHTICLHTAIVSSWPRLAVTLWVPNWSSAGIDSGIEPILMPWADTLGLPPTVG